VNAINERWFAIFGDENRALDVIKGELKLEKLFSLGKSLFSSGNLSPWITLSVIGGK